MKTEEEIRPRRPGQRRVLAQKNLLAKIPLSRITIWRLEREGKFPSRLRLTANRIGWFEDEIEEWLESRPRGAA